MLHIYYVEFCAQAEMVLIKIDFTPQSSRIKNHLKFMSGSFEFLEK